MLFRSMALAQLGEASDDDGDPVPASAMLERARIAALLRAHLAQLPRG